MSGVDVLAWIRNTPAENAWKAKERDEVAMDVAGLMEGLRLMVGAAYPVSTEINLRGYNWSEAYLDQALPISVAALAALAALTTTPESN